MEQKIERECNWEQLSKNTSYHPKWGREALIEMFNPSLEAGTYYLTKHYETGLCLYYQVRSPDYEKNQQLWVECIRFFLYSKRIEVEEHFEFRLLVKGKQTFSWGFYQENQSKFHVNIAHRPDKRIFDSLIDLLASIPCTLDAPADLNYRGLNSAYSRNINYHRLDYSEIRSLDAEPILGRKKVIATEAHPNSLFDWMPTELGMNVSRRLDWFSQAQAKSVSKQWYNFFQDRSFAIAGYHPHWGERVFYELFNPELEEGTFYFTRVKNEYRLYVQKREPFLDNDKTLWVECQHFTLNKAALTVNQIDELRMIYFSHDGCCLEYDSFKDYGGGAEGIGIASYEVKIEYDSLNTYMQQFLPENAASRTLPAKRADKGCPLRMPNYCEISSISGHYEQYKKRNTESPKALGMM